MSYGGFTTQMKEVFYGNILLIVCCLFYLGWWLVAFYPGGKQGGVWSVILISAAAIIGAAALYFILRGINTAPYKETLIPSRYLLWGGMAAYVLLFALTSVLLKRRVTTELLLILGWAVLELSILNVWYGMGEIGLRTVLVVGVLILLAVIASLICYVLYYRLEGMSSYIDGMIPLITESIVMLILTILMGITP